MDLISNKAAISSRKFESPCKMSDTHMDSQCNLGMQKGTKACLLSGNTQGL